MRTRYQIAQVRKSEIRKTRYGMMVPIMLLMILLLVAVSGNQSIARAQGGVNGGDTEYFTTRTIVRNGQSLEVMTIKGPPTPPPGYELERAAVDLPESDLKGSTKTLTVPAFDWVMGCSAVSGSMIAGYYDRNGYPNMYTGPTGGGVTPLDNSSWGTWTDGAGVTYPNIPLAASHQGVDGRTTKGSIDDYWVEYGSSASDPYVGNWTQHTWGSAIGDYMKTSQSAYSNTDGSTSFYTWTTSADPLTCADMVTQDIEARDGTYGRKLFYQARGYTVTDCYNQKTDNNGGGFTYAKYKAEINANRPVMLNLAGHTVVGVGYNDPSTVYIHDTWDYSDHSMTWGGSYSGMELLSVSIVNLAGGTPPTTGFNSSFNGSKVGWSPVKGIWNIYSSKYYRSTGLSEKFASAKHTNTYGNFTYEARMKRSGSCTGCANNIIIRGNPGSLDSGYWWKPAYVFEYSNTGKFSVWKTNSAGTFTAKKGWTASSYIVKNGWNTLKVTANGTSLKFYINGHLLWSGVDSLLKTGQVGLGFYRNTYAGTLDVDWAKLTTIADLNPFEIEEVAPGVEVQGGTIEMAP